MGYCTTTAVDLYLIGYNSSNTATASVVAKSIERSESKINSYLGQVYDISTWSTTTPPAVRNICEQLSAGYSTMMLSRGSKESLARATLIINDAVKDLVMLKDGSMALYDTAGSQISEANDPSSVHSNTENYSNTFNEDSPLHWKIDKDKKTDISSERL